MNKICLFRYLDDEICLLPTSIRAFLVMLLLFCQAMAVKAYSQKEKNTYTAPRLRPKSSKKVVEDDYESLITAEEYASRNAILSSLVVAWSPCLPQTSGCGISTANVSTTGCSVLAVGGKSGVISLWRIHKPESYSIMNSTDSNQTLLVGLLKAHDTWITTISWELFISDASDPLLLLATGCSNGRYVSMLILFNNHSKIAALGSVYFHTSWSAMKLKRI